MAFDHEFDIGLCFQHGRDFAEDDFGGFRYVPFTAIEEQLVGDIDIDDPLSTLILMSLSLTSARAPFRFITRAMFRESL